MADLVYMHKDKWTDHLDAIRAKAGTSDTMTVDEATTAVEGISGGTDTSDATLNSGGQMLNGVTAYSQGTKYTGTIPSKTSSDLTASGATVTVPAGYYASESTKSVASGSATTPATSITANPSISVDNNGLITASVSGSQSVTPTVSAGYVSSGTAGTVSVSGSNTSQLSTQAAATITPSTSQQTAVAANKYTTGAVVVDAMPTGTAGTPTASKGAVSNHSVAVTPSVTNSTGYITGGTKTGAAVSVSASELVSGNKAITENGTGIDVANYSTVSVDVQSGSTVSVVDTTDSGGGTVRTITASGATIPTPASDISKLILNGVTQMDVTDTTATVSDVASGKVFTQVDGVKGTGTASGGGYSDDDLATRNYTGQIMLSGNMIRDYAFAQSDITSVTAPNITSLAQYAFYNSSLTTIKLPLLTGQLDAGAFQQSKLTEITADMFPLITRIARNAFYGITTLTSVTLPHLGVSDTNANGNSLFNACTNLEVADLGTIYNVPNNTFTYCSKLKTVVLRRNAVCAMGNINAFQSTPYRTNGNTSEIYVPASLVSSYQTASNWSTLYGFNSDVFKAIEGSYYETHYADGTVIS